MQRTMKLVIVAGFAGAVCAAVLGQLFATPSPASAWAGAAASRGEVSTGTVDVLGLLQDMLDYEPYAGERQAEDGRWNGLIGDLEAQLNGVVQSLQALDPTSPDPAVAQPLYDQYQQLSSRLNQLRQQAGIELDRFTAAQLADAYARIHAAVQKVAEVEGIERVFSTRLTSEDLKSDNTNVIVQEVLLRPVLRDTTARDLTALVRADLGVPENTPETAAPAPEGPGAQPEEQPTTDPSGG